MFDFCISGGGMIGAATALGLARQGYTVAVIEAATPQAWAAEQPPDLRVCAISLASARLLQTLGAWQYIPEQRLRAYNRLSVWEQPDSRTDFDAAMLDTDILGYFVENRLVQLACIQALSQTDNQNNIEWIDARITRFTNQSDGCEVALDNDDSLRCRYLIGADGAQSQVRALAHIGTTGWQYRQQALGITVETQQPQDDWTWQAFQPSGPRAFLPMYDNFGSFVWYDSPEKIAQLRQLDNARLEHAVTEAFPAITGPFKVINKAAFPLTRMHAHSYVQHSVILIGDAAHTINPLAGQGVNIGFKDVEALLAVTAETSSLGDSAFNTLLHKRYARLRRMDNLAMMSAMDGFYLLFSNTLPPVKWVRNRLLELAQHATPARQQVLKYAMGMHQWKF